MARPRKFSAKQVRSFRKKIADDKISISQLATELGVAYGTIKAIVERRTYIDVD